jgi:hypothetical protein
MGSWLSFAFSRIARFNMGQCHLLFLGFEIEVGEVHITR